MEDLQDKIIRIRKDYSMAELDEKSVKPDPFDQFAQWFQQALDSSLPEPNAMSLATVDSKGRPSLRIVLLRGVSGKGFVFYTNYKSRKGNEISDNPHVALTFFWPELERQIRIEGKLEKLSAEESDVYFASRPEGNKIGAWASPQSRKVESREFLEKRFAAFTEKFSGTEIPRPKGWGGFRLLPRRIEFWQGRNSRMHDRVMYESSKKGKWKIFRLAP